MKPLKLEPRKKKRWNKKQKYPPFPRYLEIITIYYIISFKISLKDNSQIWFVLLIGSGQGSSQQEEIQPVHREQIQFQCVQHNPPHPQHPHPAAQDT